MPPLLMEQKGLVHKTVRPSTPIFANEALVLRQRFDAGFALSALHYAATGIVGHGF
jgi:hypothetical protein